MTVSIVIPNWNGEEKLRKNLPKVLKTKGVLEVVVVDDASPDKSVAVLKSEFPRVRLIEKKVNTRFADTVNLGVIEAKGDLVLVLNNDAVTEEDTVIKALEHFYDEKVFSVSCNTGGSWSWARFKEGYFWHYMSNDSSKKPHQTLWSSGGGGIFRKDVWKELGGLDTVFAPFYEEDLDIGYRATKRGYINIFEPSSKVEHYKQIGVNTEYFKKEFVSKVAQRNQLIFIWKNIHDQSLIRQHILALVKKLVIHPKYWVIFMQAVVRLPKILKERELEKKRSMVTDREILEKFA